MDAESNAGGCALGDRSDDSGCESEGGAISIADSFIYQDLGGKTEASWARDRRELEASKLSFLRTMRHQQQVDESVRLLLRRLEELPCQSPLAKGLTCGDADLNTSECHTSTTCVSETERSVVDSSSELEQVLSGSKPQRIAAVRQLLRKGVDMAGAGVVDSPVLPTKKAARTCRGRVGKERCTRQTRSKQELIELDETTSQLARKTSAAAAREVDSLPPARPLATPCNSSTISPVQHIQSSPPSEPAEQLMQPAAFEKLNLPSEEAEKVVQPVSFEHFQTSPSELIGDAMWPVGFEKVGNAWSTPSSTRMLATPKHGLPQAGLLNHNAGGQQAGQSDWAVIGGMAPPLRDPFESPPPKKTSRDESVQPSCERLAGSDPFSRWQVNQTPDERDESLGPSHVRVGMAENDWRGWTVQTSGDGELFYYHEESRTSQWRTPRELLCILGDWVETGDNLGNTYWANDVLGMSCWSDPRCTANIFHAAYEGDKAFVDLYLYGKGKLDVVDSSGCTALHYASASSSEDMVAYLLEKGASPDKLDLAGGRPLHWACRYSHAEATRLLLEAGADPDRPDSHGDSPLHLAAGSGCKEATQHLIAARANTRQHTRKQGVTRTPLQVAVAAGAHSVAALLRDYEQKLACQFGQGNSQVHAPAELRFEESTDSSPSDFSTLDGPTPVSTRLDRGSPTPHADEDALSPVKAVARVAGPLLRGVQWLANRVIPVDDARTKCWEVGRGTPRLEKDKLSRLIDSIPRGVLEQVVHDDMCFDDPPGFQQHGAANHGDPFGHA